MTDASYAPTAERLAKSKEWERPETGRKVNRLHHRTIGVVEGMKRRGWISDAQSLAFEAYERAYLTSARSPGITIRYGESSGGSSDSEFDPLDRKIAATNKVAEWDNAIGYPNAALALRICATDDTSLELIGRKVCGEGNKTAAIVAAKTLIQIGLYRLAKHMAILQHFHTDAHPRPG